MRKNNVSGHKSDDAKVRLELLPPDALVEIGKVLTLGALKYGDRNWERGIACSRVHGALLRHSLAWFGGEDADPETGLSHMAHCAANALFLLSYELRQFRKLDDRPRSSSARSPLSLRGAKRRGNLSLSRPGAKL